jgi:tRNA nucleotidyltransferase (CCA-adding enzyme)
MLACDLARPFPAALGVATRARRALALAVRGGLERLPVTSRGRITGAVRRADLERAVALGLGHLPLRALVLDAGPRLPRDTPAREVRAALARPGVSFVLVGAADTRIESWIVKEDLAPRERDRALAPISRRRLREGLGSPAAAALERVARTARELGISAYLVGGPVRDLLLGRRSSDLDVVVSTDVLDLAGRLGGAVRAHAGFLTAKVTLEDGLRVDVARARAEVYPRPAALPAVRPAGVAEDLARRDFTINAMAVRLTKSGAGSLLDPYGGRQDVRAKRIRVLHALSFVDDPSRAFRAVRFATRLGFEIEPRTAALARAAAAHGLVGELSGTRLRRELAATLEQAPASAAVGSLARLGLWRALAPGIALPHRAGSRLDRLESWLDRNPGIAGAPRWALVLAVLVARGDRVRLDALIDRLGPPRSIAGLLRQSPGVAARLSSRLASAWARARPSRIHAACHGHRTEAVVVALASAREEAVRRAIERYLVELRQVRPAIAARDLLEAGIPPGPAIARGLTAALHARLDGKAGDAGRQLGVALRAARRA